MSRVRIPSLAPIHSPRELATNRDWSLYLQGFSCVLRLPSVRQVATRYDRPRLKFVRGRLRVEITQEASAISGKSAAETHQYKRVALRILALRCVALRCLTLLRDPSFSA